MILAFSVSRKEYNMYKKGQLFPIGPDEKGKHYWHKVYSKVQDPKNNSYTILTYVKRIY
jgi:hypothetical protein